MVHLIVLAINEGGDILKKGRYSEGRQHRNLNSIVVLGNAE